MRLIDADLAIAEVQWAMSDSPSITRDDWRAIIEALSEVPPAQPERKRGKWTKENACEFCGFQPWFERDIHTLSFCPNCGADMREGQDG